MPLTATHHLSLAVQLDRDPAQARFAREQARKALADWGLGEHAELGELIVSELVTNALRYGDGMIELRLSYADGDLWVGVHDHGSGRPARQRASADDERGRGLALLDGLIELYGGQQGVMDDSVGTGKAVYVAVSLPDSMAGTR